MADRAAGRDTDQPVTADEVSAHAAGGLASENITTQPFPVLHSVRRRTGADVNEQHGVGNSLQGPGIAGPGTNTSEKKCRASSPRSSTQAFFTAVTIGGAPQQYTSWFARDVQRTRTASSARP